MSDFFPFPEREAWKRLEQGLHLTARKGHFALAYSGGAGYVVSWLMLHSVWALYLNSGMSSVRMFLRTKRRMPVAGPLPGNSPTWKWRPILWRCLSWLPETERDVTPAKGNFFPCCGVRLICLFATAPMLPMQDITDPEPGPCGNFASVLLLPTQV